MMLCSLWDTTLWEQISYFLFWSVLSGCGCGAMQRDGRFKQKGLGSVTCGSFVHHMWIWLWCRRPACWRATGWGGEGGEAYSARGGGADRGDEPREALWKCHCHFDSWTVFKKGRCWPFPPLCRDKEPGRQRGEPGLGSAPRGMFRLNKQLWTMNTFCPPWHSLIPPPRLYKVWKLSRTASGREAFEFLHD